ncbi:alpha-ketoglutarate-dependent taurine dioxygenase [Rhodococcus sp. SMB37]|uniref:TauD/TfdA dioxygenase family protein n=1 Tax=Rhodococcus sp. SMB37 TaxID=2512213 RepID=UPI0006D2A7B7|nr:TauD/TfdA family dioxygenase [Rhodococcus sp. SMB37]TCN55756.1 alpha-ketoglutarate-dependent taurine dioxygenase [Rhodococcus sp. SMB37]
MESVALSPLFGTEFRRIENLDDDVVVARVLEALKWRGVVLIRGLHLDNDAQIAFSRRLGEVVEPVKNEKIMTVSLDPEKTASAQYLKGTFSWHIDDTTNKVPAKATTLTARQVAEVGGRTEFASTYAAYEQMSEHEKKRYEGLRVVHSFEAAQRTVYPDPTDEQVELWRKLPQNESSLIWDRRDGRRSLVVGATADHVVGMDPDESRRLLDDVLAWSTQKQFSYLHEWEVGDLVLWDNTGILHRAESYDSASGRLMQRTTIAGDEPWT